MFFPSILLFIALSISAVAAYYSIVGLTAIFAAAVVPIVIMGSVLEVGKIATTIWLHTYWARIPWISKTYLTVAVAVLMFITSMGIFGFLSKAHIEQTMGVGDNSVQIEVIDSKIQRQTKRISDADMVIGQLDQAVNTLIEYDRVRGPSGAIAVREQQKPERQRLNAIIDEASDVIAELRQEKLVLQKEQIAIEAEVGPIKYIAELVYGDANKDLLEQAVRWVIIIIVFVFDPLAVMLVLAATMTFNWNKKFISDKKRLTAQYNGIITTVQNKIKDITMAIESYEDIIQSLEQQLKQAAQDSNEKIEIESQLEQSKKNLATLQQEKTSLESTVQELEQNLQTVSAEVTDLTEQKKLLDKSVKDLSAQITELEERPPEIIEKEIVKEVEVEVENTARVEMLLKQIADLQADIDKRDIAIEKLAEKYDLVEKARSGLTATADEDDTPANADFGVAFPNDPGKGDLYLRVDFYPSRLYKWNGVKWIQIQKDSTDSVLYNEDYIEHVIDKISSGEYAIEDLSDAERDQVETVLNQRSELGK